MANWLLKTEPDEFSYDDLVKEKRSVWDGVANATALIHIRKMKKGDLALIYHTGKEKAAVAVAEIVTDPYPDPQANDPKVVVFDLKPKHRFDSPVTLAQIKADPVFAEWELVRISRLSVMPVPAAIWKKIEKLSEK
jgi:predicted RNA-binding protein with PUA-like domain